MSSEIIYNHDQLAAISHPQAPLMILAGPGTGKTATLVGRIVHLIRVAHIDPDHILALTFTDRAAGELKDRISEQLGTDTDARKLAATTFHSFCYQIVLEFRPEFSDHSLMTDGDALFLLQEHYADIPELNSVTFRREPVQAIKACHKFFSRLTDELITLADLPRLLSTSIAAYEKLENDGNAKPDDLEYLNQLRDLCAIYPLYQQWKEQEKFIDYGDMITGCWDILSNDAAALTTMQNRYSTVIVDEFQDNNYALNLVINKLVSGHSSITVVGDEDQCIYSFRGASPGNFIDFEQRYGKHPQFAKILLGINYRSTQPLIDLATEAISHNADRTAKSFRAADGNGPLPEIIIADTKSHTTILAQYIKELQAAGEPLNKMAVLVRSARQARETVGALTAADLPSTFVDINFFQLPSIRTILAWCALVGQTDSAGLAVWRVLSSVLLRAPTSDELRWLLAERQISRRDRPAGSFKPDALLLRLAKTLRDLTEKAATESAAVMVWQCLEKSRLLRNHWTSDYYPDRLALINLYQLITIAMEFTSTRPNAKLDRWFHYMTVMRSTNSVTATLPALGSSDNMVQVLTVHKAKGLEFQHVFIGKLASGSFPTNYRKPGTVITPPASWLRANTGTPIDEKEAYYAEELRIFYVALTRAEKRLTMLIPEKRKSRLVKDLPNILITERNDMAAPETQTLSAPEQLISQLKTDLTREVAAGRLAHAREIIDAIELAFQHLKGLQPDTSGSRFQARLDAAFQDPADAAVPVGGLVRLSASRMNDFERCSLMYRYKHQERIPAREDSKPALAFGNLIHRILEEYHRAEDSGQESFAILLAKNWKPEEFAFSQQADQYFADATAVLKQYEVYLAARQYTPSTLAVEHPFEFQLGDALITGRIDHIYASPGGGINLIDYKTSKSKATEKAAQEDLQLALYAIYCQQADDVTLNDVQLGKLPEAVTFFFIRDPDPEVRIQYSTDELLLHKERIAVITSAIRQEKFEPTIDDRICMYCDYKDLICPKWEAES